MPGRRPSAARPAPLVPRSALCRCGQQVFFHANHCPACDTPIGYDPDRARLMPLAVTGQAGAWAPALGRRAAPRYSRCAQVATPAACNWLVPEDDGSADMPAHTAPRTIPPAGSLCCCCRLTPTLPDFGIDANRRAWTRLAAAQRRLLASLIALGLPVGPGASGEPGLRFALRPSSTGESPHARSAAGGSAADGYRNGVITVDADAAGAGADAPPGAADRPHREAGSDGPGCTLLGHLRVAAGHHYWHRLVAGSDALDAFRTLFGDERAPHDGAQVLHEWAETWAHYLQLRDAVDTARACGLAGDTPAWGGERWQVRDLDFEGSGEAPGATSFLDLIDGWLALTGTLNELANSLGRADCFPFFPSRLALHRLHFVHRVVMEAAQQAGQMAVQPSGEASVKSSVQPSQQPAVAARLQAAQQAVDLAAGEPASAQAAQPATTSGTP